MRSSIRKPGSNSASPSSRPICQVQSSPTKVTIRPCCFFQGSNFTHQLSPITAWRLHVAFRSAPLKHHDGARSCTAGRPLRAKASLHKNLSQSSKTRRQASRVQMPLRGSWFRNPRDGHCRCHGPADSIFGTNYNTRIRCMLPVSVGAIFT